MTLTLAAGLKRKPPNPTMQITIDGKTFVVPAYAEVDGLNEGYAILTKVPYGWPVLSALTTAKSLRIAASGAIFTLPSAGLAPAWAAFKRSCRF